MLLLLCLLLSDGVVTLLPPTPAPTVSDPHTSSSWETSPHGVIRLRNFCYSPRRDELLVFGRNSSVAEERVHVRAEYKKVQFWVALHHAETQEVADAVWNPHAIIVRFSGKHHNLWHLFQIYIRYLTLRRLERVVGAPDVLLFKESTDRPLHAAVFGARRILRSQVKGGPPRCYSEGFLGLTTGFDSEDVQQFVRLVQTHFHMAPPTAPRCPPLVLMTERTASRSVLNWQETVAEVQTLLPGYEVRSVRWHTLGLLDQIRLSSSGVAGLVGVHGQNLLWTVFMTGGVLVQICPPHCFTCQEAKQEVCFEPLAQAQNVTTVRLYPRFALRYFNRSWLSPCDRVVRLPRRDAAQIAQACDAVLHPQAERCGTNGPAASGGH